MKKALVMFVAATFTALLVMFLFSTDGLAQRSIRPTDKGAGRLALVIGNGAYADAPLKNATNDGRDVAAALRRMGFDVIHKENADKRAMVSAIDEFGKRLRSAEVGLLYYAGHGVQVDGRNYLIPVGAHVTSEGDVEFEGVDAGRVLAKMDDAGSAVNVLILDACRDNPFARSFRSESKGLAKMDAPKGTLIAYSTAPGSVAADGEGRNGVYTKYFLEHIGVPGVPVELVLKKVRADVMVETNDKQVPWESSSLTGDFCFVHGNATPTQAEVKGSRDDQREETISAYVQEKAGRHETVLKPLLETVEGAPDGDGARVSLIVSSEAAGVARGEVVVYSKLVNDKECYRFEPGKGTFEAAAGPVLIHVDRSSGAAEARAWVYIRSQRRVRRLPVDSGTMFFGTAFSWNDLVGGPAEAVERSGDKFVKGGTIIRMSGVEEGLAVDNIFFTPAGLRGR